MTARRRGAGSCPTSISGRRRGLREERARRRPLHGATSCRCRPPQADARPRVDRRGCCASRSAMRQVRAIRDGAVRGGGLRARARRRWLAMDAERRESRACGTIAGQECWGSGTGQPHVRRRAGRICRGSIARAASHTARIGERQRCTVRSKQSIGPRESGAAGSDGVGNLTGAKDG